MASREYIPDPFAAGVVLVIVLVSALVAIYFWVKWIILSLLAIALYEASGQVLYYVARKQWRSATFFGVALVVVMLFFTQVVNTPARR